ncbi:hypothetical protein [Sphingomonas lycopersici]|uniref:Anti-sigma factor n=1 Tax=Sphingomonas lycopersici TaxID=2951807 RepID=A0AA42CSZ9_9SPHN|nr:hypothetical protein [Sphingomonas lycopersici]MCW6537769.1 hypothetical protein [Sphingomonas lycopersici]
MAETIDETRIIAWVDGELDDAAAARVAGAVAADPALAALAERHRRMKARFAAAFAPLADAPAPERPAAEVVSLAAARKARAAKAAAASRPAPRRWMVPGAIAASLLVGVLVGHGYVGGGGAGGARDALALPAPTVAALDRQLSGDAGAVRVAMTFRDRDGSLCRGFTASGMASVACRADGGWRLRYAVPATTQGGDYRQAGGDAAQMAFIQSIIAGDPLDRAAETKARADRWGK